MAEDKIDQGSFDRGEKADYLRFTSRVLIALSILISIFLLFLFVWYSFDVLLIGFIGVILAVFLRGLADWIAKATRLPSGWVLFAIIVVLFGGIGAFFIFIIPHVTNQVGGLQETLQTSWNQIRQGITRLPLGNRIIQQLPESGSGLLASGALAKGVEKLFRVTFYTGVEIIVLFFVGLYLAADPGTYIDGIIRLFPIRKRPQARQILGEVGNTLRWWLVGIFFDMTLVGVLTGIGLWILNVPLALILAIISGLLTFIPTVGLLISLIPAVLIALTGGLAKVISVIVLYVIAHVLEAYIAAPLVQQKAVSLPPALMILSLFIFEELFGFLGLLVAAPLTAVVLVLIKIIYVEHVLGDKIKKPEPSG